VPFIEASTEPGAVVLDPFCGSGMTGVAAIQAGRTALLSDLSPGAVHLARNHTRRVAPETLLAALNDFDAAWMQRRESDLYACACPTCGSAGLTRHLIWSDVVTCQGCLRAVTLWTVSQSDDGRVPRTVRCPSCSAAIRRAGVVPTRTVPAQVTVACAGRCGTLQTGPVSPDVRAHLDRLSRRRLKGWVPTTPLDPNGEMYRRSALHLRDVERVDDFYLPRAKLALAELWQRISEVRSVAVRDALRFAFTNTAWHSSRMRRYNARGGQRPLTGTLYIPQLIAEANVFQVFRHQVQQVAGYYTALTPVGGATAAVRRSSATDLSWLADDSVDYVFTDPPFGSNIFYADCNIVWEAWLGRTTNAEQEIVVNRSRTTEDGGKTVSDYERLLRDAFAEIRRVVRPTGRASIVFHNSDDQVWSALLGAAEKAGLRQVEVSLLDKVQRSMKGYRGRAGLELVPFYDLVITFTPGTPRSPHLNGAGEIAVETVRAHLRDADHAGIPATAAIRSLEYLYSLAVGGVVRHGARPDGLSFRAFEAVCRSHFTGDGRHFALS
jgi:16S rRNA G966 N2-methylase RsmD